MPADRDGARHRAAVLADAVGQLDAPSDPQGVEDHLALIEVVSHVEADARSLLRDAVTSARSAGATWSEVGRTLGMTKQAAQKRFATQGTPLRPGVGEGERLLGPVTVFDEMGELALAGQYGWHGVERGAGHHRVVRSATKWEHARVSMLSRSRVEAMRVDGWQVISSEFPYVYLKRDLGTPALTEPRR
ncbi:MAG: hypothetical protein L0H93_04985 [Nocardioides sp.]|nr:hypothetical protein [Nocardioides sp.]